MTIEVERENNTKDEFDFWLLAAIANCWLACDVASCEFSMLEPISSNFKAEMQHVGVHYTAQPIHV